MRLFPNDAVDIEVLLAELLHLGMVRRYAFKGCSYLLVVNFLKHQHPHVKEQPSKIPPPPPSVAFASSAVHRPQGPGPGASPVQAPGRPGASPSESESESESVRKDCAGFAVAGALGLKESQEDPDAKDHPPYPKASSQPETPDNPTEVFRGSAEAPPSSPPRQFSPSNPMVEEMTRPFELEPLQAPVLGGPMDEPVPHEPDSFQPASTPGPQVESSTSNMLRLRLAYQEMRGEPYVHGGPKDNVALKALLEVVTIDEILARWRAGLTAPAKDWRHVSTVAQLRSKWNDLVPTPKAPVSREDRPSRILR
jgi:hypothetical protein